MADWRYTKGLHDLGNGAWAYLQPDGGWGWSNAGLIVDGEESLLVDTLFDERLTAEMLTAMEDAIGSGARDIATLVNTHANGDHTFGNRLLERAEIIASRASAEEMAEVPPQMLAAMMAQAPSLGQLGKFLTECFGAFEFRGIEFKAPTRTFEGTLSLRVGDKALELIEVGPAHTKGDVLVHVKGDVLVHVPGNKVVYTGDILFVGGTPIIWAGPVENWIAACERLMAMDLDAIVPGHGPITDRAGVAMVRDYLVYIDHEARQRFDAGLDLEAAIRDIRFGDFSSWGEAERIAVNVDTLYRNYAGDSRPPDVMHLFSLMAELAK